MRIRTSDPEAGFAIDESLGYLVNQLAKKLAGSFNERLAEYGLTTTQWGVLACLWREDGLSQRDLSRRTGTDPATLTEMLKRMEARGLVRRVRDPDNNRLQRVYLTELLRWAGGNVSKAARKAQLDRMHLHRLFQRYGLRSAGSLEE